MLLINENIYFTITDGVDMVDLEIGDNNGKIKESGESHLSEADKK